MIVDSHQHVMLPTSTQIQKMDDAGVDKAVLFTTAPHVEKAKTATLDAIGAEMQVLYQLLAGGYSPEARSAKMKGTIVQLHRQTGQETYPGHQPRLGGQHRPDRTRTPETDPLLMRRLC